MTKLGRRGRARKLASKASVLLLGALGVLALANESGEKLDGSGFPSRAARAQPQAWGEMRLTEGDEGFAAVRREYALAVQAQPETPKVRRVSGGQGMGARLER